MLPKTSSVNWLQNGSSGRIEIVIIEAGKKRVKKYQIVCEMNATPAALDNYRKQSNL